MNADSPVLIVGLGNPGEKYANTRHNIGVQALEELASRASGMPATFSAHKKSNALIAETTLAGRKVILARPRSFMNLSGGPVKAVADFFKVPLGNVIVLFDDLELDFGVVKLRAPGVDKHATGDHGHNGLRSITKAMGKNYIRAGIGIGRPPGRMDVSSFVLKPFSKQEQADIPIMCADIADEVERFLTTSAL
ncbi:MAG: aminoacyl-tRNA hydrolase [Corynebacterium sp.]|uniref:aminoacyl-tRNA hydrolase n=1 Tax=Corynebacterium sp. TaxID=1720 RepID=UPI0026DB365C|nr:aminoacyl-tRNA hydrolase [Corynebacterium sp.]MDO5097217.1 aminoacyl-tRNA hydrolase [Corynebacterium sp.]